MDFRLTQPLTSQTSFALRFSTHLLSLALSSASNLAFSPLSIHALLALLAAGSCGATLHQLLAFLGSPAAPDLAALHSYVSRYVLADGAAAAGPCLRYVGGVWVDAGATLKSSFREVAREVFNAEAHPVPFRTMPEECRDQINKWVEQVTAGQIKDLFPSASITGATRVVLGNAIYFKGSWLSDAKFDVTDTRTDKFYLIDGSCTETFFMASWKKQLISAYDGFKVLIREDRSGVVLFVGHLLNPSLAG